MSKMIKFLIGVFLLCLCMVSVSACSSSSGEEYPQLYDNKEIKIGNYYLDGDVSKEYIKITENFGFQYVGFDFYNRDYELNKDYYDSLDETEKAEALESLKNDAERREKPRYYQIARLSGNLVIKDTPEYVEGLYGEGIIVIDENSLEFDKDHIYNYVE